MIKRERALLIGVNINNQTGFKSSMDELENLAIACDLEVAGKLEQNLKAVNSAHYIGSGKVNEVVAMIEELKAEVLVFNNELSHTQLRNLEKAFECRIVDRTALILEIFAKRARTKEAKLQVEVARLQYMLPRLIGSNESLGRQRGGVGTRNRGAGETKLEMDRRKIERKIIELNKELELIADERYMQRKQRSKADLPTVALVGYTNAGKSTLMNAMVEIYKKSEDKKVFEKDMLFATLETSIRSITLPSRKTFLLADTVGFVSNLPHDLIKAFRSTLEEVCEADLLLNVVDVSNPNFEEQIEVTRDTLKQIGAEDIPMINVFNKADLTDLDIPIVENEKAYISAREKIGINELTELISEKVLAKYVECKLLIPFDKGGIVSYFKENAHIQSMQYETDGILLTLECKEADLKRYGQYAAVN